MATNRTVENLLELEKSTIDLFNNISCLTTGELNPLYEESEELLTKLSDYIKNIRQRLEKE